MSDDRSQMMFDILLGIQADVAVVKREQAAQGELLSSLERLLGLRGEKR